MTWQTIHRLPLLFRPLFNLKERIIGGREAKFGEAPYQARIRYFRQMSFGSQRSDHQCGGTLISSCWVLTGRGSDYCTTSCFFIENYSTPEKKLLIVYRKTVGLTLRAVGTTGSESMLAIEATRQMPKI